MGKNDEFLLSGIVESYIFDGEIDANIGEKFEYLCIEQILKSFDLSNEEIKAGHTDGRLDGGIDAAYIFVNGIPYDQNNRASLPKSDILIEIHIITCKHENTFREATINTLLATSQELFNFSLDDSQISSRYNSGVMRFRKNLSGLYRSLAILNPKTRVNVYYATRGDTESVGDTVSERAKQLESVLLEYFRDSEVLFQFWGAAEILDSHRKTRSMTLEVPIVRDLSEDGSCFVALCKLENYYKFLCDENGNLRRYLMEANIRDYLGENKVNSDIKDTLQKEDGVDFWWLNNGVTILASTATIIAGRLIAKDIQIINGLQTSQTIYHHFRGGDKRSLEKSILIKVITSGNKELSDKIIVASNNQSLVQHAAFRSNDVVQRNIEEALELSGWHYERRPSYYKNMGAPDNRIIAPMYLASGFVAVAMKNPIAASSFRSRMIRDDAIYDRVFPSDFPIEGWSKLVEIQKIVEAKIFDLKRSRGISRERFNQGWRGLVSLLVVARIFGTFDFPASAISKIDTQVDAPRALEEIWSEISNFIAEGAKIGNDKLPLVIDAFCKAFDIKNANSVGKQTLRMNNIDIFRRVSYKKIDETLLDQVDMVLPPQPWPKGVHKEVASKLSITHALASDAIQKLILSGRRSEQIDGEVVSSGHTAELDTGGV